MPPTMTEHQTDDHTSGRPDPFDALDALTFDPPAPDGASPDAVEPSGQPAPAAAEDRPPAEPGAEASPPADRAEPVRDVHGRFAPRPKGQDSESGSGTPGAPAAAPLADPQSDAASDGHQQPDPRPFVFRAMGGEHEIPGAVEDGNGHVTIPVDAVPELREAYNALHVLRADTLPRLDRLERENAQLRTRSGQPSVRERQLEAAGRMLFERLLGEDGLLADTDEGAYLRRELGLVAREIAVDHGHAPGRAAGTDTIGGADRGDMAASGGGRRDAEPPPHASPHPASLPPEGTAVEMTRDKLAHLRLANTYRDLQSDDWTRIRSRLERMPYAFVRAATAEEAQQLRRPVGTLVFDDGKFAAYIQEEADVARKTRETVARAAKTATDNSRRTIPAIVAPPTVGGSQPPPKTPRRITSPEEARAWFDSDEL